MVGAALLPQLKGARSYLARRCHVYRPPLTCSVGRALQHAASGSVEAAQRAFLNSVGERVGEKIAADPRRRLGPVKSLPSRFELLGTKGLQKRNFCGELVAHGWCDRADDCPPPCGQSPHMARFPIIIQSLVLCPINNFTKSLKFGEN
jgi:hypothetical protein